MQTVLGIQLNAIKWIKIENLHQVNYKIKCINVLTYSNVPLNSDQGF